MICFLTVLFLSGYSSIIYSITMSHVTHYLLPLCRASFWMKAAGVGV